MTRPDLFTNVHKGIRRALFEACVALGRATEGDDDDARDRLRDALRFTARHADNEDALLLPLLRDRDASLHVRMAEGHAALEEAGAVLAAEVDTAPPARLYALACAWTARWLDHLDVEERELEAPIRAVVADEEIVAFGRGSVERTPPADQRRMLTAMLPALPRAEVDALLGRLPAPIAAELRPRVG
jgi:hypothetical protein